MGLDFKKLAQNLMDSAKLLVENVVPDAVGRDSDQHFDELDAVLELDDDTCTVINSAMNYAKGFNPKVYVSWAIGGVLALSLATNAFAGGAPAEAPKAPDPAPAPIAQAAEEPEEEEPQDSDVKIAVVVPEQWPADNAEAASVTVTLTGTTDEGDKVDKTVSVVPGSSRSVTLEPGTYKVAAQTAEVTLGDVVFAATGESFEVDGSGDALAATVTFKVDETKTQAIADEKAAAEEAARQEAERQAEEQRKAEEEAEAQRQAEAEAEKQRQAEAAAAAEAQRNEQTVYITDTGSKYHNAGCRYLKKSKHAISLSDAKARGYEPCKVCH